MYLNDYKKIINDYDLFWLPSLFQIADFPEI